MMPPNSPSVAATPTVGASKPSLAVKAAYGFGSVASGVTETGFNYFLLIFYS